MANCPRKIQIVSKIAKLVFIIFLFVTLNISLLPYFDNFKSYHEIVVTKIEKNNDDSYKLEGYFLKKDLPI